MRLIFLFLVGLLSAIGVAYLLAAFQRWVLRPHASSRVKAVLPLGAAEEDAELKLRSAYGDLLQGIFGESSELLVVDCGMDQETLLLCRRFCEERSAARLCTERELHEILRQGLQKN